LENPLTILITGANGFVGSALIRRLRADGASGRAAVRQAGSAPAEAPEVIVGDLGPDTDWTAALDGCSTVIHLSARVHVLRETALDPLLEFRRSNALATGRLASQAAEAGVTRLIYLSSIGVNGNATFERPFHARDPEHPAGPYAQSKFEGERAVTDVAASSGLETVIVRAPLVYGAAAGGHFGSLLRGVARGIPLPLGHVDNRRTLCSIDNLVAALRAACDDPSAPGALILAADRESLSTPELIRALAEGMGRRPRLLGGSLGLLRATGRLTGRLSAVERLTGSLEVEPSSTRAEFEWPIPVTARIGLVEAAAAWADAERAGITGRRHGAPLR
jgi:nucleoside-diphosphate-sugar epimerase